MDPLTRKLFQPREAREKLRGMGGIMSSSPQLASTVAKFNVGGPIQSRSLGVPSAPDAPLPSAGRARATNVGGRAFVLTEDGRVLDAQTGAPATPEVEAEVRSRLSPQLNMMDIVGGVSQIDPTGGGVNPSFREATSGQLPPTPSDLAPMSEPATTADPAAEFDMGAFQQDLIGAGRAVAGPGLMAIDDLAYDGPLISPVQPPRTPREDTHSADLRAAIEAAQAGGPSVEAPADGTSFADALSNRPRMAGETFDSLTGKVGEAFDSLKDKAGEFLPDASESFGTAAQLGTMLFPGVRLPASEIIEALPETPVIADAPVADAPPVADTTPPAPTLDVDLDDPDTYDTNFEEMMRRLGGATGKDDKSSRQKAMADLAMIGLAIAAGQSPDALTNIAQGALTGVKAIRAEDAATSAADRETRTLAARLATEQGSRDKEIASRERIAGMNLEGRGDSYAKLLLTQINKVMAGGMVDIAEATPEAERQLAAAGIFKPQTFPQQIPIQMTAEERSDEIRRRIKVAQDAGDTKEVQALKDSIEQKKLSPSDFGL